MPVKTNMPVIFRSSGGTALKNRQDSVMEITAWVEEHFQESCKEEAV